MSHPYKEPTAYGSSKWDAKLAVDCPEGQKVCYTIWGDIKEAVVNGSLDD